MTDLDVFEAQELLYKAHRLENEARLLRLTVKVQTAMKRLQNLKLE